MFDRFDPKQLQVAPGLYDFTKAYGYDEELTRHNLNYVVRPNTAQILAPPLIKPVIKKEKPNFVKKNMSDLTEVSSINMKRVQMMKQQNSEKAHRNRSIQHSSSRRSEITRMSTEPGSTSQMQSPKRISGIANVKGISTAKVSSRGHKLQNSTKNKSRKSAKLMFGGPEGSQS